MRAVLGDDKETSTYNKAAGRGWRTRRRVTLEVRLRVARLVNFWVDAAELQQNGNTNSCKGPDG